MSQIAPLCYFYLHATVVASCQKKKKKKSHATTQNQLHLASAHPTLTAEQAQMLSIPARYIIFFRNVIISL